MNIGGAVDRKSVFSSELNNIKTTICNAIAKSCIENAPEYFWVIPASSTGKYHPKSSLGVGGLVRHTKSVMEVAEIFLGHPQNDDLTQEDKDEIRVACMIHDMVKLGDNSTGYTVHDHPVLVRTMLCPYDTRDTGVPQELVDTWNRICDLVDSHMGTWNTSKHSDVVLPIPSTRKQNIVHMSDYIASRKTIAVDINMDLPKSSETSTPAVEEKATQKQIDFIQSLDRKCSSLGVKLPSDLVNLQLTDNEGTVVISKSRASEVIKTLLELVNG